MSVAYLLTLISKQRALKGVNETNEKLLGSYLTYTSLVLKETGENF